MNSQNKPRKIAIVAYNLEPGGLANVIQNVFKILQSVSYFQVKLILLDERKEVQNKNIVILSNNKFKKYFQLFNLLNNHKWDYIIDLRYRINPLTEVLITKFIYPKIKTIYNVHSSRLQTYLPKNVTLVNWLYGTSYKIVCGAKGNEDLVVEKYNLKNTCTLYNPIDINFISEKANEPIELDFEYILAVGRVEEVKQFDLLIEAYSNSILVDRNIKLVIVGDGSQLSKCKEKVKQLNLEDKVIFEGFSKNPYKYMKQAKFFVLSSKYEGFGLVLVESLACRTPVISFDLQTGPNEIITHEDNGLLVKNQDFDELIKAMNCFENEKDLYNHCKANSVKSISKFAMENIKNDWLNLLK